MSLTSYPLARLRHQLRRPFRPKPPVALPDGVVRFTCTLEGVDDPAVIEAVTDVLADVLFGGWDRFAPKGWDVLMSGSLAPPATLDITFVGE